MVDNCRKELSAKYNHISFQSSAVQWASPFLCCFIVWGLQKITTVGMAKSSSEVTEHYAPTPPSKSFP